MSKEQYKELAKIFFFKGTKAFSLALENNEIPNWTDFFDNLWNDLVYLKLSCPECGYIITYGLELNFTKTFNTKDDLYNKHSHLYCYNCSKLTETEKWKEVE